MFIKFKEFNIDVSIDIFIFESRGGGDHCIKGAIDLFKVNLITEKGKH